MLRYDTAHLHPGAHAVGSWREGRTRAAASSLRSSIASNSEGVNRRVSPSTGTAQHAARRR